MNHERKKSIKEEIMFSDYFANLKSKISYLSEHNKRQNRNIYDVFKNVVRFRKAVATVFALVFSFAVTVSYASPQYYDVEIVDGNNLYDFMSTRATVGEILDDNGVELTEYDIVTPELNSYITSSQTVVVQRIKKVSVTIGGRTTD